MKERSAFLVGFLALTAFTVIGVVGANLGFFGEVGQASPIALWGLAPVVAEVVGATIMAFKWLLSPYRVSVVLDFTPMDSGLVDLNADKCTYEIREDGKLVEKGYITVASTRGGWECTLPLTVKPKQVVSLSLREKNGEQWDVKPFYPLSTTQKAIKKGR